MGSGRALDFLVSEYIKNGRLFLFSDSVLVFDVGGSNLSIEMDLDRMEI